MERRPLLTATGTGKRSTSPAFVVIFCLYHRGLSCHLTLTPALRRPSVRLRPRHLRANPSTYTTPRSTRRPMVDVRVHGSTRTSVRVHGSTRTSLSQARKAFPADVLAAIADRSVRRASRPPVDCCMRRNPPTSDSSWMTTVATHVVSGAR